MKRREAFRAILLLISSQATASRAQSSKDAPIVGVPLIAAGPTDRIMQALREGLRDRGYVDGQNLRLAHRSAAGKVERLPALLQELVQLPADVIVAGAEPIVKAAMQATRTVPIVMVGWGYDPVAAGYVESLNRPGGNVTGIHLRSEEMHAKRLELLRELLPGLSRIAALYDPIAARQFERLTVAAKTVELQVLPIELSIPYDFDAAFKKAKASRVGAVVVLLSPNIYVSRERVAKAAVAQRLPTVSPDAAFAYSGGLMSYGPSTEQGWRRAAYFVDRLLKGARPGELPVEQADVYALVVNIKTAKALGFNVPDSILVRADEVVR
jgi:putative ABC transport system substrate-binding protein